ncbi:hypothetical protein Tco_0261859 [Tanacetum coccineum]
MGEGHIISANESLYKLVSLEHKFFYKVDELRALSGHVLRASRVQVPEDDLNDLHWTQEEDGEFETMDPQFLLGSKMLEVLGPKILGFLRRHYRIGSDSSHRALCSIYSEGPFYRVNFYGLILLVATCCWRDPIFLVLFLDCGLLVLVDGITPVEDNKGLLVVCLVCSAAFFCVVLDDSLGSRDLTFLVLFIGVTTTNFFLSTWELEHVLET